MEALIVIGILSAIIALGCAMRSGAPSITPTSCAAPEPINQPVRPVIEKLCEMIRLNDFKKEYVKGGIAMSRFAFDNDLDVVVHDNIWPSLYGPSKRHQIKLAGGSFEHTQREDDAIEAAFSELENVAYQKRLSDMQKAQAAATEKILAYQPKDRRE